MTAGEHINEAENNLQQWYDDGEYKTDRYIEAAIAEALIAIAKCLDSINKYGVIMIEQS